MLPLNNCYWYIDLGFQLISLILIPHSCVYVFYWADIINIVACTCFIELLWPPNSRVLLNKIPDIPRHPDLCTCVPWTTETETSIMISQYIIPALLCPALFSAEYLPLYEFCRIYANLWVLQNKCYSLSAVESIPLFEYCRINYTILVL